MRKSKTPALSHGLLNFKSIFEDAALEDVDPTLSRPPLKSLKQHLLDVKSHSSGVMRAVRTNQITSLSDLYNHARYGVEVTLE